MCQPFPVTSPKVVLTPRLGVVKLQFFTKLIVFQTDDPYHSTEIPEIYF